MDRCNGWIQVDAHVVPKRFPVSRFEKVGVMVRMSSEVNLLSAGSLCEFHEVSSTAFVSSAKTVIPNTLKLVRLVH